MSISEPKSFLYSPPSWEINQGFELKQQRVRFKAIKLQSAGPAVQLVFCYFEANKPEGCSIGCVTYILNTNWHTSFYSHLVQTKEFPKDIEAYFSKQLLQAKRENLVEEQVLYLEKLSDLYLQKKNWVQAAKLLNCALAILEKNHPNASHDDLSAKLERIEVLFLESKEYKVSTHYGNFVVISRKWLKETRNTAIADFKQKIPPEQMASQLTSGYCKLLRILIQNCQEQLGEPPCEWACIGMGSMARQEMCLYSDLEFAFLIEKKTEKNLEYFRTLAQLVELRIINLGETKFPIFAQLFGQEATDASPTSSGFCMDSGGNTPLGKRGCYELIDTPLGLAQYQSPNWMNDDIILTNALTTTCFVVGNEEIFSDYEKEKEKALNLTDGFLSFTGTSFRKRLALKLLQGNLIEFKPNLSKEKQETNAFGIKKELYRPLQSIISSIALFCGFKLTSTYEMVLELQKQGIFSLKGADNLVKTLKQILALRFEAHAFYQNEEEFLIHLEKEKDPHYLYLDENRLKLLYDIYMVLIPLQRYGEQFIETQDIELFAKATFYDESPSVKGKAFSKTLQYAAAQEAFQNAVSLNPNDIDAQLYLRMIEERMGQSKEALPRNLKALKLTQQKYGENHIDVAICYSNIGMSYINHGDYDKALDFCRKALMVSLPVFNETHSNSAAKLVAASYNKIGLICENLGDYDQALDFHYKTLELNEKIQEKNQHKVGLDYNNISMVYEKLGDYAKALQFCQKSMNILVPLLGENHPDTAHIYNNYGLVYYKLNVNNKAFELYQKSLEIRLRIFGENHPDVALSYNNIGAVYDSLDNNNKALELYQKALTINLLMVSENHPDVAQGYNNIGAVYKKLADYDKALTYFQKALKIQLVLFNENHPMVAISLNNIGLAYHELKDYATALEFLQSSLKSFLMAFRKPHIYIEVAIKTVRDCVKEASLPEVKISREVFFLCAKILGEQHPLVQELVPLLKENAGHI